MALCGICSYCSCLVFFFISHMEGCDINQLWAFSHSTHKKTIITQTSLWNRSSTWKKLFCQVNCLSTVDLQCWCPRFTGWSLQEIILIMQTSRLYWIWEQQHLLIIPQETLFCKEHFPRRKKNHILGHICPTTMLQNIGTAMQFQVCSLTLEQETALIVFSRNENCGI